MAAMASFDGLNSMIAELEKKLDDFDAGIDESFAQDFIGKSYKVFKEQIKQGNYGNT
jgi:hypothetical protein